MDMVLNFVLVTIFAASFNSAVAQGRKAKVLLKVRDDKTYELVEDVLKEISHLRRPIRVLAAVGNARVGKSSMLNLINHVWDGRKKGNSVEEIFKTGDSFKQVTRNVWSHTIIPRGENSGSIVLLDVEGFNLGNDTITKHLSMFTAMMSSCLNLFANDYLGNKDKEFLYEISRSSDLVFNPDKTNLRNFPTLHIVVRGNLKSPDELESYVRDELFGSDQNNGVTQSMADIIERYFPRDRILVSQIPTVNDPKILQDLAKIRKSSHWDSFDKLIDKSVKECPVKQTIGGSKVDGPAFVELATKAVRSLNENSWKDFGDVFSSIEKDICMRSYMEHIKPVLQLSSGGIGDRMIAAKEKFQKECLLTSEIERVTDILTKTLKEKSQQEEEKRREEEEKERREKEEQRRRKEEEEKNWYSFENIKSFGGYAATLLVGYFLSDENLKSNVTVLPSSRYNDIGLTGVCWKWNDIAQQKFGLTGEACGVIAQEVQKLYPKAVLVGEDGFLQVRYGILHEIISNHVRNQSC